MKRARNQHLASSGLAYDQDTGATAATWRVVRNDLAAQAAADDARQRECVAGFRPRRAARVNFRSTGMPRILHGSFTRRARRTVQQAGVGVRDRVSSRRVVVRVGLPGRR